MTPNVPQVATRPWYTSKRNQMLVAIFWSNFIVMGQQFISAGTYTQREWIMLGWNVGISALGCFFGVWFGNDVVRPSVPFFKFFKNKKKGLPE